MKTEMHEAVVYSVRLATARKVVFTFDLREEKNENLYDKQVIARSMAGYMLTYPNVEKYEAVYVDHWLVLSVHGTVKMHEPIVNHIDEYL